MAATELVNVVTVALANGGSVDDEIGAAEAVIDAIERAGYRIASAAMLEEAADWFAVRIANVETARALALQLRETARS